MSFQLCASCRHPYPPSSLRKSSFTDNIGDRLGTINGIVADLKGKDPEDTDRLEKLRLELQSLCASIHEEFDELNRKISTHEKTISRKEKYMESKQVNEKEKHFSGSLNATALTNTTGEASNYKPTFNNSVPSYNLKKMNMAFELVSCSIFRLLESIAVQTRADTALLWLRPSGFVAVELIAPFVVGRNMTKLVRSAPYRVPESSIPCAVGSTGIAVNIKPREGARDPRATNEIPLLELIEQSNAAQLLAPVYSRGKELDRNVLAVVHLIGSPRFPFPFNRRNEETTVQGASLLTSLLSSHYETMIGEWTNRFYDPSLVQSTSQYRLDLDLRSDEKGMDDFSLPPTLIYRCVNDREGEFDAREASKELKQAMTKSAAPLAPLAGVKDLHRHATAMEHNWSSAVQYTSRLEDMIGTLKEEHISTEVDEIKTQREKMAASESRKEARRHLRESKLRGETTMESTAAAATGTTSLPREEDVGERITEEDLALSVSGRSNTSRSTAIRPEQVDELEFVALQRLRDLGVDTSAFSS